MTERKLLRIAKCREAIVMNSQKFGFIASLRVAQDPDRDYTVSPHRDFRVTYIAVLKEAASCKYKHSPCVFRISFH